METSHMLRTSITDQRNNMKTLHSLLGPTLNSTNLQVFVAMQQHSHNNAYAQQYRSAVGMIRLSKQRAIENVVFSYCCVGRLSMFATCGRFPWKAPTYGLVNSAQQTMAFSNDPTWGLL
jgi:hypothetical protein